MLQVKKLNWKQKAHVDCNKGTVLLFMLHSNVMSVSVHILATHGTAPYEAAM
jgi:hypothetical protein